MIRTRRGNQFCEIHNCCFNVHMVNLSERTILHMAHYNYYNASMGIIGGVGNFKPSRWSWLHSPASALLPLRGGKTLVPRGASTCLATVSDSAMVITVRKCQLSWSDNFWQGWWAWRQAWQLVPNTQGTSNDALMDDQVICKWRLTNELTIEHLSLPLFSDITPRCQLTHRVCDVLQVHAWFFHRRWRTVANYMRGS